MALTKQAKDKMYHEVSKLLDTSKLTVVANYKGTTVKNMQDLRKQAVETGTKVKVFKNTVVIKALAANDRLKSADISQLKEQLLYAFNSDDEVAPAQVLAQFSKKAKKLEFIGAITDEGIFIGPDDVKVLADLPSKDQLRAQLVGTIGAPLSGFVNVLAGNVRGVLNVLTARAEQIN